nr:MULTISPECIES: tyrosine-type recombinase/integrase [unclassified Burkholderia]
MLGVRPLPRTTLARYDRLGSKSRHQKILREFVRILPVDSAAHAWLANIAAHAARTKAELPDIVNVMLEELVRRRYELPPLATLTRIAGHARSQLHESIYCAYISRATDACPALSGKHVSPHVVRHTAAMHILQSGVDMSVIALWLGHEHLDTTHIYMGADLALKEKALNLLHPAGQIAPRFRATDKVMAFLESL